MRARPGLTFRSGYTGEPAAARALAGLLRDIFDIDITLLDELGGPDPTFLPFSFFDAANTCVANFSVFSMPLVIDGTFVRAAGLQSGAVRPEWRGQGLFRDLTVTALGHCQAEGFEVVALLTDKPALYRPHGFRSLTRHRFEGAAPAAGTPGTCRRLDINNSGDVTLIRQRLDGRRPVSDRFAPLRQTEMFLFNAALSPDIRLDLIEDTGTVVAGRMGEDGMFDLLDIAGPALPPLADILAALRLAPSRIVTRFAPDHLDWVGEALPEDDGLTLMIHGADDLMPSLPFGLSPLAEF